MAPEQEDRTRQLEALRRYVSNLYERREPAQAEAAQPSPAPEPEPQRYEYGTSPTQPAGTH
jgi:hypothetical protein